MNKNIKVCGADPSLVTGLVITLFDENLTLPSYDLENWQLEAPIIDTKVIDIYKEMKAQHGNKIGQEIISALSIQDKVEYVTGKVKRFCAGNEVDVLAIMVQSPSMTMSCLSYVPSAQTFRHSTLPLFSSMAA